MSVPNNVITNDFFFLRGGGEMGELCRNFDWENNVLGSPEHWPHSLKTVVSTVLNAKFPMFIFWGKELIQFYNDAYRPSLGMDGKHPFALGARGIDTWQEIWPAINPLIENLMNGGESTWSEDQLLPIYRNGKLEDVYWTFSYSRIDDDEGNPGGVLVTCTETTEKVIALQNLAESEDRFRTMAESSDVLIAVADETSNAIYFNKAWTESTGRPLEDLLAFGWLDLVHPDDRERYVNIYLSAFKDKIPFSGEFRLLNKSGDYRWLLAKGPPRFRPDGSFAGYISSCIDITDRKNKEQQLQQLVNMLPASVVVIRGDDLVVEMINQSNLDYWKKSSEEVVGHRFLDILPDLADQPFAGQLRKVMATGEVIDVKESPVLFENADGTIRETFVDYTYQPLIDLNGERNGVLVMSFEITDRVTSRRLLERYADELQIVNDRLTASNRELALSEQRFKYLIQEAPVAIGILTGRELIVTSANEKILEVWGKNNAIIGLPLASALPELEGQPFLKILDDVYTTGEAFNASEIRALLEHQGELKELFFNVVYQPIQVEPGITTDILVVAVDVTEQVNARKRIEQAELTLRVAVEAANVGTWNIDAETKTLIASPRLKELFGFAVDDEITVADCIKQICPEYREWVHTSIESVLTNGGHYDVSYTVEGFHDKKKRWLRAVGNLIRDAVTDRAALAGVIMDVSDIKQEEIRKNDFIGMVSHELKTPLTSLSALLQVSQLKLRNSEDSFLAGAMDKANVQVKRMTTMINGFLNLSRFESGKIHVEKQKFDISALIKDVIVETTLTVGSHEIRYNDCPEIVVTADKEKIMSVISNLISNAIKYSPKGKSVTVECTGINKEVIVSVTDEGIGIKPADKEKIFDRYYRVENSHTMHISGFGIGLYLSAEIIYRHDGRIWVDSEPDNGSTFYFALPL